MDVLTQPAPPSGSPEWLQLRTTGIGGSDMPAVSGISRWKTAHEVYLEKKGLIEPQPDNPAMWWGRRLEPLIIERYAETQGKRVECPRVLYRRADLPFLLGNIDGLVIGPNGEPERGLESKKSDNPDYWGPSGSDSYPEDYYVQCQHYCFVLGLPLWDLTVLLPRGEQRVYTIQADKSVQDSLVSVGSEFWDRVQRGDPPPPDWSHPSAEQLLKRLYKDCYGKTELPGTVANLAVDYLAAKDAANNAYRKADALKAELLGLMGNAAEATIHGTAYRLVRQIINMPEHTVKAHPQTRFYVKTPKAA